MKNTKKVILVTGASAGMGLEMAKELLHDGHTVYGAARRVNRMDGIKALGVKIIPLDVTSEASMVAAINQIITAEGRIDVLINNAGFGSYGPIENVSIADAKYQLDVNVFGAARLMQLVLPHMRSRQYGRIINISSIGGKFATALGGWYHASKFALEALSDSLRNEVEQFGIDVVVIEPGGVKSEWSSIAADNLKKNTGNMVYNSLMDRFDAAIKKTQANNAEPIVIVNLVRKAIAAKKPKTRYSGGYMAKAALFMRKILPDRLFDKMLMSQLK
ncbi:NADP-dependent 3-hydroxy acid dehydrogenase YdfG [Mucilaginibacter gracilis]|uniref:NADP-dependent 3-hydroxy acid dehydrogenase YdfG n=1 Tax=Mucilaginibacter gracilis TaxID=423350 RepID=A0A495J867_9SPHI|nr:oxidoreductase [Mucilaginibacter gracilis]RKR84953.1 NADP-dependent 3-hydroxy acid dehydrogenase YdfG [Mucilaginibacter gracilis]